MSGEESRALNIVEEPEANFWKDEGGRSNKLRMTVQHPDGSDLAVDVPLKFVLFYESGREVEKRDQSILNLCKADYDPWIMPVGVGEVEIEFRLEKVSRRKDGQRFRVLIEADASAGSDSSSAPAAGPAFEVESVQTRPICVMSKRRTGERVVSRRAPTRAASVASYGASPDDFEHVHSTLAVIISHAQAAKKAQESTFQAVMAMKQQVDRIDGAVTALQQQLMARSAGPGPGPALVQGLSMPMYHHGPHGAPVSAGHLAPYGTMMRPPVHGQLSQAMSAMPSGPVSGTMPGEPPAAIDPQSSLPRQDSGPRRSGRRALKRERSAGIVSTPSLRGMQDGGMIHPQHDDEFLQPAAGRGASTAAAAAAAAAAEEEEEGEDDEHALMMAAKAGAYDPGMSSMSQGGAPMARLPSLNSSALDRLGSREWGGLDALSSVAGAESAKRPRAE